MNKQRANYPANVFWSDEDEGFIAVATDLPGCSAFGVTRLEALSELDRAIDAWIEAAHAAGNPIPDPSRPPMDVAASGKLLLRMPRSLHADMARSAKRENVSLNHYVVFLLTTAAAYHAAGRSLAYAFWNFGQVVNVTSVPKSALDVQPAPQITTEIFSTANKNRPLVVNG